jgi:hypothetical protein
MNGTLDRAIEQALCDLISAQMEIDVIQCVPDLRGGGDPDAIVPRVVVKAESQETPELYKVSVFTVNVTARAIVMATDPDSAGTLSKMNAAIDSVLDHCELPALISNSAIQAYGAVPGGRGQEREENRLISTRSLMVPARLR